MALQSPQLPHPPTPLPVIGAVDLELIHLMNHCLIHYVLEVSLSAVRACLPPLLCAKPVGEAAGTEVLATTVSKVSITKDFCADGADILAGNGTHKFIVISTIGYMVTVKKKCNVLNQYSLTMELNVPPIPPHFLLYHPISQF